MQNFETIDNNNVLSQDVCNDTTHKRKVAKRRAIFEKIYVYVFAILPLLGFIAFSIFPIAISFIAMFFNIDIYNPTATWTWNNFDGFKFVFTKYNPDTMPFRTYDVNSWLLKSIGITAWIASTQFITLFIALVISLLIAEKFKGSKTYQVMFFIPYICSTVAVSIMWGWIFSNESFGVLNSILGTSIRWTEDTRFMTLTIIIATIWQAPGYGIVMYKAAMANVNSSLYEAAELDGAGWFSRVIHVTLPAIRPTTFYLMMAGVIAGFMTYETAMMIVPATWIDPFGKNNMGITFVRLIYHLLSPDVLLDESQPYVSEASIISWLVFIITAAVSVFIMKFRDKVIAND